MKYINVENSQRSTRHWLTPIRSTALAVGLAASVAFTPSVQAGAIFDAVTEFDLTINYGTATFVDMDVNLFNDIYGSGTGFSTSSVSRNGTLIDELTDTDVLFGGVNSFTSTGLNSGDTINFSSQAIGTAGGVINADSENSFDFFGDGTVSLDLDLTLDAAAATAFGTDEALAQSIFDIFDWADPAFGFFEIAEVDIFQIAGGDQGNDVISFSAVLDVDLSIVELGINADILGAAVGTGDAPDPRPAPVPEPETLVLFGLGLLGMGFLRRKQKLVA